MSINNPLNFFVKRNSFREKNKYLVYKHFLSPEHFFKYVKIMMAYKGPMWVPHGLKFLYGTHMGPILASCPDSAHMGPICPCVLGRLLTRFFLLKVYGNFFRRSRAANSAVLNLIWLKFELVRDIIDVLDTCKYEENPIKNEGARLLTRLYGVFSDTQGQLTPKSAAEFCPNSKLSKLL